MFDWWKNRHKHSWKVVRASCYDSIVGPRTIISLKCTHCSRVSYNNLRGVWEVEDFNLGGE